MRSCAKFWAFCLVPVLLFGEAPTPKPALNEAAEKSKSQAPSPSAQPGFTPAPAGGTAPVDGTKSGTPKAEMDSVPPKELAELRALVEQYYAAYARKDLDALMALWSPQSPDSASRRESAQKFFAANDIL